MQLAPQEVRTFFVTSVTSGRKSIFQSARLASLFIDVLKENRGRARFLVHEFVVMPDHFHMLLTPEVSAPLEKVVQYIKGGFSFRAKREADFRAEVWQPSFTNHRIRDAQDYERHRLYIRENPVKRFLVERAEMYPYSSAYPGAEIDPKSPWLKP